MVCGFPSERPGSASPIANFILVLGSLLVGLVLAEIGIRFLAPQPKKGTVMEYASRGYAVNRSEGTALFSVGENKEYVSLYIPASAGNRSATRRNTHSRSW